MKYIYKEDKSDYDNYIFAYQVLGIIEPKDSIDNIYNNGFLLSRSTDYDFYLARSLRINLNNFSLNSENRRILSKTENIIIENQLLSNFNYTYEIGKIAIDYYKKKFGKNIISAQGLKRIFTESLFTNTFIFKDQNEILGYCPILETSELIHYAYPFYKVDLIGKNIGMGMMLKAIQYAQDKNKDYIYLGTVYTKSSLYKLQFNGLEWFDGKCWSENIDQLKTLINNG